MKIKKMISLVLAVAMLMLVVTGCGSSTTTETSAPAANAPVSETPAPAEGSNKLTVWAWDQTFNIYAMEEAGKIYKESHPDFELEIVDNTWSDIQTKLTTAMTSGDYSILPDIMLVKDNAFELTVRSFPDAFQDITDSGIDFASFASAKLSNSVIDDRNYGVPFDNGAVIAAYRTDILEAAGFTIEDFTDITWDEYIEKGKVVLEKTGKPLLTGKAHEASLLSMMMQSAGASFFDENRNPDMVGNEVLINVLETYKKLVESGVLVEVNGSDEYYGSIVNDQVAGTINGCWILSTVQSAEDQSGNWAITNMPALVGVEGATNYSNNGGSSWAVSASSQNKELAYDFLASTFAGSVELYENILPSTGALATYLPAGGSDVYGEPQEFFGGDAIYAKIADFASKTPSNYTGVYYNEARDALSTAATNIIAGADINAELQVAQDTVLFAMGQ